MNFGRRPRSNPPRVCACVQDAVVGKAAGKTLAVNLTLTDTKEAYALVLESGAELCPAGG